jgi:hypothetical protein
MKCFNKKIRLASLGLIATALALVSTDIARADYTSISASGTLTAGTNSTGFSLVASGNSGLTGNYFAFSNDGDESHLIFSLNTAGFSLHFLESSTTDATDASGDITFTYTVPGNNSPFYLAPPISGNLTGVALTLTNETAMTGAINLLPPYTAVNLTAGDTYDLHFNVSSPAGSMTSLNDQLFVGAPLPKSVCGGLVLMGGLCLAMVWKRKLPATIPTSQCLS